jgi:hypothetical protein
MSWKVRMALGAVLALVVTAGCNGGGAATASGTGSDAPAEGGSATGGSAEPGSDGAPTEGAKPGEKPADGATAAKPGDSASASSSGQASSGGSNAALAGLNIKVYPGAKEWKDEGMDSRIVQKTEFSELYSIIYATPDDYDKVVAFYKDEMKGAKADPATGDGIKMTTFMLESGKESRVVTVDKIGSTPVRITLSRMVEL